ncbi:MAG: hypothetical protein WD648_01360 [Planctomycetaceae bacterium]
MQRRQFLQSGLSVAAASLWSGGLPTVPALAKEKLVTPASRPVPGIIDIGATKQTFLDDLLIFEASKISTFVTRPQKHAANPILVADRDWERGPVVDGLEGVEITGQCVLYDVDDKLFKMWYLGWVWDDGRRPWCYAVSRDGYQWEKPQLGLYEYKGSRQNNIVADWGDPQYFNVFKDPHDPDPSRRYKAMGELEGPISNQTGGAAVAFSPDGLRWTQHPGNPVVKHGRNLGDAPTFLGWDPKTGKYVFYPRPGHGLAPEIYGTGDHRHIRSYGYSTSDDFVHWSDTELMMTPDDDDRVDYQYMQFTAGIDGEFYVGFNAVHETHEQTWDVFLMTSRDGFHWNWVDRKVPFLGRGEIGSYDDGYMTPSGPIFHDGKVWIYYGAFSGAHSERESKLGPTHMSIALCTLPQDRWVGLLAGPYRGTVVTHPVTFTGSKLVVDLDASLAMQKPAANRRRFDECEVRVAIEDQSGGRIADFAADRMTPLTASGRQEIRWADADLSQLAGKPVRLRFEMRNAALYSLQFAGAG